MGDTTDNPRLGERFNEALVYAAACHRYQLRKETEIPYVSHLLAVASIVLEHGGTEDEAIGALLHDAAEDCGGVEVLVTIRERFGAAVEHIVRGCSDALPANGEPKPGWRERKEPYIAHIATACAPVRLVSAADKLHNARSILTDYRRIGEALWGRFNAGREDQRWYYGKLVEAFQTHGEHRELIDELTSVVAALEHEIRARV
ncbi:MAG TPA: HD domain-containing protein [Dehalococcoidia bacterium]|jgi:GTP pyrophosphokinase|nr:HD domain-containing protein [Dehalococcoidia bacterium]